MGSAHSPEKAGPLPRLSVGYRLHVLLVEDDDGDALLVEEMLADALEPTTLRRVGTLAEALSAPIRADCVLLDLALPDAMGLDSVARLRRFAPGTAVVVLTGRADERTGQAAVAAGAQDYLVKSQVDGPLLSKALRYAWERKRAEQVEQSLREQQLRAGEYTRLERGLLPTPLLASAELSLVARYRPGRDGALLGGDFYDAVELADGTLHVIIGDVSGHGPDEAALGVALRIAWRSLVLAGLPQDQVLATVQQVLTHERINNQFATVCVVSVAPDRRSLSMRLAGHPPPFLRTGSGAHLLPVDRLGVPLGVLPDARWEPMEVELEPGWVLLLCTDGIFEGRSGHGIELLGQEEMTELFLGLLRDRPDWRAAPAGVLDELIAEAERRNGGPLDDDVAVVLLGHQEKA
ncbi:PP2C family protein-serine/threonine phosphatase [Amycolatopsis sp. YIM 10]|uniref:PP2C family protein-serine/threonine phosphatase n=1 Tax=Amycolatopsis sp. YIM 10 TaxID=2653857 RepID=UPI0012907289|nr:Phosphoserine phosphatase RsbU [Amycolatopsis sp. YIM 10]